jgi:hypothetical protein
MTTPYRGRGGRGQYGRGRGFGSSNILPQSESNIPLIGDWTTVQYNKGRQPSVPQKKNEASSSSSNKIISYKQIAIEEPPQEKISEFFENPITEDVM